MQYGRTYNPNFSYPVEIRFLVASGASVDKFVQGMVKRARQAGFSLAQVCDSTNAFV